MEHNLQLPPLRHTCQHRRFALGATLSACCHATKSCPQQSLVLAIIGEGRQGQTMPMTLSTSLKSVKTQVQQSKQSQNHASALNKHKFRAHSHTKQPGEPAVNTQSYMAYMMLGMHRGTRHSAQKSMLGRGRSQARHASNSRADCASFSATAPGSRKEGIRDFRALPCHQTSPPTLPHNHTVRLSFDDPLPVAWGPSGLIRGGLAMWQLARFLFVCTHSAHHH